ncbi:TetR/AcrR family transcriptional regulator [Sphingomonas sp. LB2R24]|uniref:TetR/AcrR family transcriptional regulator n=1 Tax=Sphingomonas sorbitolis TaxID=3096165 RepID=UPI002FCAB44A
MVETMKAGAGVEKRPAERRRNPDVTATILATTYALLREQGFRQLTIEGVAARAGVGKATIYRWWSSKGALAVEAFLLHVTPAIDYRGTGSSRRDIALQMRKLAHAFAGADGTIIREMLAMAQFDGETLHLFKEGYLEPRRVAAREMLALGVQQGEFRSDFDPDVIIDGLYGPIHHRLMLGRPTDDETFLKTIEEAMLSSIAMVPDVGRSDAKHLDSDDTAPSGEVVRNRRHRGGAE